MKIQEIKAKDLKPKKFIDEKVREIREIAGDGIAINALSGGVDSSVVTMLAHRALGKKLKTYFIDNGIMREGEPKKVKALFAELGIPVRSSMPGQTSSTPSRALRTPRRSARPSPRPSTRRCSATSCMKSRATVPAAGDDPHRRRGDGRRDQAPAQRLRAARHRPEEGLRLQDHRAARPAAQGRRAQGRQGPGAAEVALRPDPLPGAGAGRPGHRRGDAEKIALVRKATAIVEKELQKVKAFQYMAILHEDRVTGMRGRQAGLRPADRDPLLGQRRRPDGHADQASLADARADRREDPRAACPAW